MPDSLEPLPQAADELPAGLRSFFRTHGLTVHEVTQSQAGCYIVWAEGNLTQAQQVIDLLPHIPQIVAYRLHPTSNAILELYALGAELPANPARLHYVDHPDTELGQAADAPAKAEDTDLAE